MKCYNCAATATETLTNYIVDLGECIIIIRHVPSFVCPECGETMYVASVAKQLEAIVALAKNNLTEIIVMNYSDRIA